MSLLWLVVDGIQKQWKVASKKGNTLGLPWWSNGKESAFQCRGCGSGN